MRTLTVIVLSEALAIVVLGVLLLFDGPEISATEKDLLTAQRVTDEVVRETDTSPNASTVTSAESTGTPSKVERATGTADDGHLGLLLYGAVTDPEGNGISTPLVSVRDQDGHSVGASPGEGAGYVLVGLASCLTAGIAAVAQHRDIQLRSVTATLEGGMDIQGILGIDKDVRNGFDGITVSYKIDADASPADIEALVAQSQKLSAVYDILANPTNITVKVN